MYLLGHVVYSTMKNTSGAEVQFEFHSMDHLVISTYKQSLELLT